MNEKTTDYEYILTEVKASHDTAFRDISHQIFPV